MRFIRQGKAYQLVIQNGCDLEDVLKLDEALWVSLAAPTSSFLCDSKFLELIDSDGNKRISSNELEKAIAWLLLNIKDHATITENFSGKQPLAEINSDCPSGQAIIKSAKYMLNDLSIDDQENITLDIVRKFQDVVRQRPLNGDGVISLNTTTISIQPQMADFVKDAITATGGTLDVDGTNGVTLQQIKDFYADIKSFLDWFAQGKLAADQEKSEVMPLGAKTPELLALLQQNEKEIDRFFQLSKLLAFDNRLEKSILSVAGKVANFDPSDLGSVAAYQEALPIAQPNASGLLPCEASAINPRLRDWFAQLYSRLIEPQFGKIEELSEERWQDLKVILSPYAAYLKNQVGKLASAIPVERLQQYQANPSLVTEAEELARRDATVTEIMKQAGEVERLLLYRANLLRLTNNFVSFPELYQRGKRAMFERGSAVFDGRWFNVVVQIDNLAAHQARAKNSSLFVIYLEVALPTGAVVMAAPVTTGSKGELEVGKQGVFFDLAGTEHAAKIVALIENPVCFKEALLAPFTKISKMVETRVETWASASENATKNSFGNILNDPLAAAKKNSSTGTAPTAKAANDKTTAIMGISVAFAAVGSALAFISKTIAGMSYLAIIVSVICAVCALALPFSILAFLKLNRQDLSALLEGNGWAINSRMRMTNAQRMFFSREGRFPDDAEGTPKKRSKTAFICCLIVVLVIAAIVFSYTRCVACSQDQCESANKAPSVQVCPAVPEETPAPAEAK